MDVKNIDDMLLIPAKTLLSGRQINILKAWGVGEIDVEASDLIENQDPRLLGQRARNQHHLALAAAQLGVALVGQAQNAQPVERFFGNGNVVLPWRGKGPGMH